MNLVQFAALLGAALLAVSCGGGKKSPATVQSITVAGTITAPAGVAVDSDVNDPQAPFQANDSLTTAQAIPNPASVGGYVNVPGAGASGRSTVNGDPRDFYRLSLVAGQIVRLDIASGADLDLYLYVNCIGTPQQTSAGIGATEQIDVAATGNACVEIRADAGASNYVLSIGLAPANAEASGGPDIAHDFVPGEIIVRFRDSALPAAATENLASRAETLGLDPVAGAPRRAMLMRLGTGNKRAQAFRKLGVRDNQMDAVFAQSDTFVHDKWDTLRTIKALRRRADVAYAEPNYIRRAYAAPNDQFYPLQWHYPLINLPQAWDVTGVTGGAGAIVAVIDTGIVSSHPDFSSNRLVDDFDFISDPANELDGTGGRDSDASDPGDQATGGSSFHGTHVAGTIAAATNNATGVAGAAGGAKIMPLRVLGKFGGTSFDIMEAVKYAARLTNVSGQVPALRADVINLSLGGQGFSQAEQDVYTQARGAGCIVIAAAGNENSSSPSYPAAYLNVVSVSAVGPTKLKAPYSNFGSTIDVAAPGGDGTLDVNGDGFPDTVLSTVALDGSPSPVPNYAFYQGTSMAAPHIAGVAALMAGIRKINGSNNGFVGPGEFDALLQSGAITTDIGTTGRDDNFGYGLIDAHKAVVAAGGTAASPSLAVSPPSLNFRTNIPSALISVSNGGGGTLAGVTVTEQVEQSWLGVAPDIVDANGNGTWRVTIDRTLVPDGTYTGTLVVNSTTPNVVAVNVEVIMQKTTAPVGLTGNAGRQYILLVDAATNDAPFQTGVGVVNGQYVFSISGVQPGNYVLIAGTDLNGDFTICDPGEACGAWPTLDQPATLTINASRSGLDFSTSFDATLAGASSSGPGPARRYMRARAMNVERR